MRLKASTTFLLVACLLLLSVSGTAAEEASRLTLSIKQTTSANSILVTLYGAVTPAKNKVPITVQSNYAGKWINTKLTARTTTTGKWSIRQKIAAHTSKMSYRAIATVGRKKMLSPVRSINLTPTPTSTTPTPTSTTPTPTSTTPTPTSTTPTPTDALAIDRSGPGGRILGADISLWQHSGTTPIDFAKMYSVGTRFVMIKASDTHDAADATATKYFANDRLAAQAAGLYTGLYHYAYLPDTTDQAAIVADAKAQAEKAIWRLASVGGYTAKDLPYTLDLENNCVEIKSYGGCAKRASKANTTLFALTWLSTLQARTGRAPILYSYPSFLEGAIVRDSEFRSFPLWIAHYGVDPNDPLANPGQRAPGCYVTPWTQNDCTAQWSLWQFTSCGSGSKYGVFSSHLDLNVFRGGSAAFLALTQGTWIPQAGDFLPVNEPTSIRISDLISTTTNLPVTMKIDVVRVTGLPVVTGGVRVTVTPSATQMPISALLITQSAIRSASGTWNLSLRGLAAGTWNATIDFKDPTGVHAPSTAPITFVLAQGVTPTPTPTASPTPTPKPTPKPKPVDYCLSQFPY